MREIKEDSTRGRSYIRPKRYKRDALVQVWMDRRKIAMLSVWLDKNGYETRFMSEVLKWTVEIVANEIVKRGEIEEIELTEDANAILKKYRVDLNPGGRGEKNLTHNLVLDGKRSELENEYSCTDIDRPVAKGSIYAQVRRETEEQLRFLETPEGQRKLREVRERGMSEDLEKQKVKAIENARASGRLVESEYETKRCTTPARSHVIDLEDSQRRALAEEERVMNLDMMPPAVATAKDD